MEGDLLLNNQDRLRIKYAALAVLLGGALVTLDQLNAFAGLAAGIDDALDALSELGVFGMFVVGVIGNASILIQVPYTLPLLSVALHGAGLPHMLVLGLAAGLGAGVGEVVSYKLAHVILARNPHLPRSRLFQWVDRTVRQRPRLTALTVFIWAASPLPDDTVIVPLAAVEYGLRRLAPPLFLGKVAHNIAVAWLFWRFSDWAVAHTSAHVKTDLALGVVVGFVLVVCYQAEKAGLSIRAQSRSETGTLV